MDSSIGLSYFLHKRVWYQMMIKKGQEEAFAKDVEISKRFYLRGIVQYAQNWADDIEKELANGKKLSDVADRTSHTADRLDTGGITGAMYNQAIKFLYDHWIHGEELAEWHNRKYDYTGPNIVNSSSITIARK